MWSSCLLAVLALLALAVAVLATRRESIIMPIISAGVCDKKGALVVSRQYVEMGQAGVLDLYSSLPRGIRGDQQHTYVETGGYRFFYVPCDELYVVLVTSQDHNIIEGQETLKMLYRVVISVVAEGVSLKHV
jgi:hypothetical protein